MSPNEDSVYLRRKRVRLLCEHVFVSSIRLSDLETGRPRLSFTHDERRQELECDVIAGCDGFHGISRDSIPHGVLRTFEREYPFGWLGILAQVAPSMQDLSRGRCAAQVTGDYSAG